MTNQFDKDDMALDALLSEVRRKIPVVSDDLMARILADAADLQPKPDARPAALAQKIAFFPALWSVLGGWSGASGLTAVAAVGLWIGLTPPALLDDVMAGFWGDSVTLSVFPADDLLGAES